MITELLNAAKDWLKSRREHKYCWTCRKRTGDQRCKVRDPIKIDAPSNGND